MKTIPLTQGKVAIVDDADYDRLIGWKWFAAKGHRSWYAMRCRSRADGPGPHFILMHRTILSAPVGLEVGFISGDGLDNRRSNLRLANRRLNARNRMHHKLRDLPPNVYPTPAGRYKAVVCRDARNVYLGVFYSAEEASRVAEAAKRDSIAEAEREFLSARGKCAP